MRDPFANYDQWKTASPYDDHVDATEPLDLQERCTRAKIALELVLRVFREEGFGESTIPYIERAVATLDAASDYITELEERVDDY